MQFRFMGVALTVMMFVFFSCNSGAQSSPQKTTDIEQVTSIEVLQFHSERRCMTCNLIEELTREALEEFPDIPFKLINVDDPANEQICETFEAVGTALFVYDSGSKKKKELTDFAFMNAKSNADKFKEGIKKEVLAFKQ